ncbi:hypothetical protein VTI74DRAFT_530 [Chaetomium olivicolor]
MSRTLPAAVRTSEFKRSELCIYGILRATSLLQQLSPSTSSLVIARSGIARRGIGPTRPAMSIQYIGTCPSPSVRSSCALALSLTMTSNPADQFEPLLQQLSAAARAIRSGTEILTIAADVDRRR